jgi:hypothetical protein
MAWLGRKKLAFIPLSRTNIQPPDIIPTDWTDQIMRRVFFDPPITGTSKPGTSKTGTSKTGTSKAGTSKAGTSIVGTPIITGTPITGTPIPGTDRSLRTYFHTVSSGLADLDVVVLSPQTIPNDPVNGIAPDALEATQGDQLRSQGFVGAAIVMLGGPGGGSTAQLANFAWSRFCMSDDLGNWAGEILHQTNLCDLPDLFDFAGDYPSGDNMGPFDQEAGYLATHPSAWTKRAVGWLDPSTVALPPARVFEFTLHSISLIQPPPTGRVAAVQIGGQVPYLMVEARQRADQFDINIPNEGVIVYRVQTSDPLGNAQNDTAPLALLTKTALTVGQSFTTGGVTVQVVSSVPGGFSIQVVSPSPEGIVPDVRELSANVASKTITNAGFIPKFTTKPGSKAPLWVFSQSPAGGSIAALGSTVNMLMHGGPMQ